MTLKSKAAAFAAIGIFAIAVAQDGTVLRHTFKEGADTYTISTTTKSTMKGGPQGDADENMSASSTLTITYKKVNADGSVDIERKSEPGEIKGDGFMAQAMSQTKLEPVTGKGKIDSRNVFTMEKETGGAGIQKLLGGGFNPEEYVLFINLPEKAVKVGDSWPLTVKKNIFISSSEQTLTARLTGEKDVDGVKAWTISVMGNLKVEPQIAEVKKQVPEIDQMLQGADLSIHGTLAIDMVTTVDKATGRPLGSVGTLKGENKIEISGLGAAFTTSGSSDVKISLKK